MWLDNAALAIFLAILTPTVSFCALNQRFFTSRQLIHATSLVLFLAMGGGFGAFWIFEQIKTLPIAQSLYTYGISLTSFLGSFIALTLFVFLHERFFTENLIQKKHRILTIFFLYIVFVATASLYSIVPLNTILGIFFAFSLLDAYKKRHEEKQIIFAANIQSTHYVEREKKNISLAHKKNIYFLLLESYLSAQSLKKLYDIDDAATDAVFEKYNFTDYKNFFCNRPSTLTALKTLFNCQLLENKQEEAFALDVLRENGYQCEFFDISYYVFGRYMKKNEYASFYMSPTQYALHMLLAPIWAQSYYLRRLIGSVDPFEVEAECSFEHIFAALQHRLSLKQQAPRFFAMRFGATHQSARIPWKKDANDFIQTYTKTIQSAQKEIKSIVESIVQNDPEALIIAVGDHGSLRHSNVWFGKDATQATLDRGVSIADLALDHFGVRCAIRWPQGYAAQNVCSHVNIFHHVFLSLGAIKEALPQEDENISILPCNAIAVRDGVILEKLEPYDPNASIYRIHKRYVEGNASLQECLTLASRLQYTEAIKVLEKTYARFPESNEACLKLGEAEFLHGQVRRGFSLVQELTTKETSNEEINLCHAKQLLEVLPEKALPFIQNNSHMHDSAEFCFAKACACLKLQQEEKALDYVEQLKKYGSDINSHYYACCVLLSMRRYQEACTISRALQTNAKAKIVNNMYFELAMVAEMLAQNFDEAEKKSKEACSFRERISWNWIIYSHILQKQGKLDAAFETLVKAAALVDNSLHVYQALGRFALQFSIEDAELNKVKDYARKDLDTLMRLTLSSGVFDKKWYQKQNPEVNNTVSPYWHYLTQGMYQGMELVPWFNSFVFLFMNPILYWSGAQPFSWYLEKGIHERLSPSLVRHPRSLLFQEPALQNNPQELLRAMHKAWS